jgi:hypothetical protein
MRNQTFRAGQVFRPASSSVFGRSGYWQVADLYVGIDGREYARLVNAADRTEFKTVVVNALADSRLFSPDRLPPAARVQAA